jgi:hypothetical protein
MTTTMRVGAALLAGGLTALQAARADDALTARVDRRVQAWQPTRAERRLDDVGWARDVRDALRLAKEHNRPVFLFTYNGSAERADAMALQRC